MGEYLKSMVYGGMDGIITTFAIVCAASGANKDEATILTMVSLGCQTRILAAAP